MDLWNVLRTRRRWRNRSVRRADDLEAVPSLSEEDEGQAVDADARAPRTLP